MLFSPNGYSPPLPSPLKIGMVHIDRIGDRFETKSFKLVGVHLDDILKWQEHIKGVRSKLAKTSLALARLKRTLPQDIKLQVYNSLFKCHMDYCLPIWGECSSSDKRSLFTMQKKTIRNITQSKYNSHTDPIFKQLKILKFEDHLKLSQGTLMFGISLGSHPKSISELFNRSDNFDRNLEYVKDKIPYTYLQKQVPYSLVSSWNSLPVAFRGWLKEEQEQARKVKRLNNNSTPTLVSTGNNYNLNKFRLNSFKLAMTQTTLSKYSFSIHCHNKSCRDCSA